MESLSAMRGIKKKSYIVFIVVILLFVVIAGCSRSSSVSEEKIELSPTLVAEGEKLFNANCTKCHGDKGIGESSDVYIRDERGDLVATPAAPPLDDTAHAWHHTDGELVGIILNGSPQRNTRMMAWKEILSEDDARAIVAYIKSLWSQKSLECQGPKHMNPGC